MQRAEVVQLNVQRVANYGKGEIITRGVFAEKPIPVIEHLELNRCFRWYLMAKREKKQALNIQQK